MWAGGSGRSGRRSLGASQQWPRVSTSWSGSGGRLTLRSREALQRSDETESAAEGEEVGGDVSCLLLAEPDIGHRCPRFDRLGIEEPPLERFWTVDERARYVHALSPVVEGRTHRGIGATDRSEEHTSELQSLMRISYAVFCLKKKKK